MSVVAPNVEMIDLKPSGLTGRTSGYLLSVPRPAIVEVGGVHSVETWLQALEQRGISVDEIAYVIVTHVHLDHAGGTGTLIRHLPKAKVVVHPRGARHIVDPSRLIKGARSIFGDRLEQLWGVPEPVPENRVVVGESDTYLDLGGGHKLRFFDAPGHAAHQFMLLDESSGAMFTGDEMGVRYIDLPLAIDYVLPITSPNQYNPEGMLRSVQLLLSVRPEVVLYSHFGALNMELEQLKDRLSEQIGAFTATGADVDPDSPDGTQTITLRLIEHTRGDVESLGLEWEGQVEDILISDLRVSALGIVDYWKRQRKSGK